MKQVVATLIIFIAFAVTATAEPLKMIKSQKSAYAVHDSTTTKTTKLEEKEAANKKPPQRSFKDEMLFNLLGFEK